MVKDTAKQQSKNVTVEMLWNVWYNGFDKKNLWGRRKKQGGFTSLRREGDHLETINSFDTVSNE